LQGEATEVKGRMLFYSVTDGKKLKEVILGNVPQWDGMAVAYGKLFVTTEDGKIICFK